MRYAVSVLSLVVLCGLWVVIQQWIAKRMPDAPGIGRRCDGCTGERCRHDGAEQQPEPER